MELSCMGEAAKAVLECPTCLARLDEWVEDPLFLVAAGAIGAISGEDSNFGMCLLLIMQHVDGHPPKEEMLNRGRAERARWN